MKYSFLLPCVLLVFFAPPLLAQESCQEFERSLNLSEPQRIKLEGINKRYMDELTYLRWKSAKTVV